MPWPAVALALVVAAASLGNGFAYDDLRLLVENERVNAASGTVGILESVVLARGRILPAADGVADGTPVEGRRWRSVDFSRHNSGVARTRDRSGAISWRGAARTRRGLQSVHSSSPCTRFMSRRWPTSWGCPRSSARCCVLGAACSWVCVRVEDRLNPRSRLGVIALGVLASLSKEQGFVTPALLLATAGLVDPFHRMRSLRKVLPVAVALALVLASLLMSSRGGARRAGRR